MTKCRHCFAPLIEKGRGRIPVFCSSACKQANYRLAQSGLHIVASRNRQRSRMNMIALYSPILSKPLLKEGGAGLLQEQPLRNVVGAVYSQVDWVGENQ